MGVELPAKGGPDNLTMQERGIDCNRDPTTCGVGRSMLTGYIASYYFGGTCEPCGSELVKGDFAGNVGLMHNIGTEGRLVLERGRDSEVVLAAKALGWTFEPLDI